ncbi:MAG: zinc-ribbon domain-containing protein [Turicibacter sp.]|nr:zinc-ribbon domain-containing protein [Turicibacter sp.]
MICPNCGKQNAQNAKFCKNCGTALSGNPNNVGNFATPPNRPGKRQSGKRMNTAIIPIIVFYGVVVILTLLITYWR